jgi:hypothetical protein
MLTLLVPPPFVEILDTSSPRFAESDQGRVYPTAIPRLERATEDQLARHLATLAKYMAYPTRATLMT